MSIVVFILGLFHCCAYFAPHWLIDVYRDHRSAKWNYDAIVPSGLLYLLATMIVCVVSGNFWIAIVSGAYSALLFYARRRLLPRSSSLLNDHGELHLKAHLRQHLRLLNLTFVVLFAATLYMLEWSAPLNNAASLSVVFGPNGCKGSIIQSLALTGWSLFKEVC